MTHGFVHIIESPSAQDLLDGRSEGRVLSEALNLAGIPFSYNLATNEATFRAALNERLLAAWKRASALPIIHLSMHGNDHGIQLTDGTFLGWATLRTLLLPLLRAMQGGLLICLSACKSGYGCRMAMYTDNEPPFWALVGNTDDADWADAAVAFVTFYHLFFKGKNVVDCVEAMKQASGDNRYHVFSGQHSKDSWMQFLQRPGMLQAIGRALQATPLPASGSTTPPAQPNSPP